MKTFKSRSGRLTATFTGKGKEIPPLSPSEARRRNLLAVTRRIVTLEKRRKNLQAQVKMISGELRFARKELKLLTHEPDWEMPAEVK